MACLGAVAYDPGTLVQASTAALLAMTAFDTTNARITFNAPANGTVLVRIRCTMKGASSDPQVLLGVLDGATVKGRQAPVRGRMAVSVSNLQTLESCFLVTGLTPTQSYTWDAAYGVEFAVAASNIEWGGPNNGTANDAAGALVFEVWETDNLLAGVLYDPGTAVTNKSVGTAIAMTAFDTTNLRLVFNAPASGRVLVKIRCAQTGGTVAGSHLLGALDGATVKARAAPIGGYGMAAAAATTYMVWEMVAVVSGLTPSTEYTWDAAYGVELVAASANIKYGGPDNTTQADAFGGFAFEIWEA